MNQLKRLFSANNRSIRTSISFIMIVAALVASVIIGVLSYTIYRDKYFDYKAKSTLDIAVAVAKLIDGDKFAEIAPLEERTDYQREVQAVFDAVGGNVSVTYLYAVVDNGDGIHYRYVFDALNDDNFGTLDPIEGFGAEDTFETGVPSIDQFYDDTGNYGDMISCFCAIYDSQGNIVGVVGADNVLSDVIQEVNSFAILLIAVILSFNALFVIAVRFFINRLFVKPLTGITRSAEKIAHGDLNVTFGDATHVENSRNELISLSGALERMLVELNEKHSLHIKAMEAEYEKERIEEASKAKSLYFARMSHEIRTPMNAVMGMSELLLRKDLPQDAYEHALMIKNASGNLLSIINDILDFSKMDSNMLELNEAEYPLASLINDVVNVVRMRITEKPIQFVAYIDPTLPSQLIGDEVRLRQVITNLLSNAAKYTAEGYISFSVKGDVKGDEVALTIEISDSGIGIKEEDLGRLFGDFVQFDSNKNKGIEGTGLGLSIARTLCRLMGGDITVQSEYGRGSVFTATLSQRFQDSKPYATVDEPENKSILLYETRQFHRESIQKTLAELDIVYQSVSSIPDLFKHMGDYDYLFISSFLYGSVAPTLQESGKNVDLVLLTDVTETASPKDAKTLLLPAHSLSIANILNGVYTDSGKTGVVGSSFIAPEAKVLIVDDVTANLKVAEGLLLPYEMQVTLCGSGREAIALVSQQEYDLVFMDHMMPEMDGLETTSRIRAIDGEYYKSLPIIALTANAVSGVREMFIQNGMNDFLAKPIETVKLDAILDEWIPKEKRKEKLAPVSQANQSEFIGLLDSMPELSVNQALAVLGGSAELYEKIMKLSVRTMPKEINRLEQLFNNNWKNYTIEVHGIKGILNNMGAYELGKMALRLEELSRGGDFETCKKLHPSFILTLKRFYSSLEERIDNPKPSAKTKGDLSLLRDSFPLLAEAVDAYDHNQVLGVLSTLKPYSFGNEIDGVIDELAFAVERFDFDKAETLLDQASTLF